MEIIKTDKQELMLDAPKDWDQSQGECVGLPVEIVQTIQGVALVSTWKPTQEELAQLNANGVINLWVFGNSHPVVSLTVPEPEVK